MNISEVKEQIKVGLNNGYRQNKLLLSTYSSFIENVREYLLTVNVAQKLLEWNEQHEYKIQLEYPVFHFYNNAFLSYVIDCKDFLDMVIINRQFGLPPTNTLYQKIDLVITEEQVGGFASTHERSICGIELKGINKRENDIKQDARRLCRAMMLEDSVSSNSIEFCFCGFLRRFDKENDMVTNSYIQLKISEEKKRWVIICNSLSLEYPSLEFNVDIFEIDCTSFEFIADMHKQMESDYDEVANATGVVVGGILEIKRRKEY